MVEGVARREKQKNTERCVDAQNHLQINRMTSHVPSPSRRPENSQGIDANDEDDSDDCKRDAKGPKTAAVAHVSSSVAFNRVLVPREPELAGLEHKKRD